MKLLVMPRACSRALWHAGSPRFEPGVGVDPRFWQIGPGVHTGPGGGGRDRGFRALACSPCQWRTVPY